MPVAIVTGGASGIGLAIVKLLVTKSYQVVIADRNAKLGEQEARQLGSADQVVFVEVNISDWTSQTQLYEETKATFGRIDVVFANAGFGEQAPSLNSMPVELVQPDTSVIDVCFRGTLFSIYLAIHYMRQNNGEGGRIITTGGQAGIYGFPVMPVYCSTKAAVHTMCRSIALDMSKEKIYVNSFCPGLTLTPVTRTFLEDLPPTKVSPMENHMKAVEQFLSTDVFGKIIESDAGGLYNRERPEPWSPEHQSWVYVQEGVEVPR
ncbi:Diacetyl [(S)-acetoin forming] [Cyphellophora attinorum]|uniref:Diacetyl [(S)-acetoin forming] n=1 Tax=Cyphellophora attinorum TaxID=1664694 RepID=A0A0N0NHC8_9EURO|nr:Diacetyl [(S)-acetoin forming] [Phialophora attinorum]KPI34541.1 Diacetyl [(S)-acetoin forming] [Phialophora attinorum]